MEARQDRIHRISSQRHHRIGAKLWRLHLHLFWINAAEHAEQLLHGWMLHLLRVDLALARADAGLDETGIHGVRPRIGGFRLQLLGQQLVELGQSHFGGGVG